MVTPSRKGKLRTTFLGSFTKSQFTSTLASGVDFGLLFSLVEFLHVWYVLATAVGATAGAITHFLFGRYWSFDATHRKIAGQASRYACVAVGSILLNTAGVYLFTGAFGIHYAISVIVVSLIVGFGYNFPLHRYWVFI